MSFSSQLVSFHILICTKYFCGFKTSHNRATDTFKLNKEFSVILSSDIIKVKNQNSGDGNVTHLWTLPDMMSYLIPSRKATCEL